MPSLRPPQIQRKIKILEDRLQQCNVRYNDSLTRNRQLRRWGCWDVGLLGAGRGLAGRGLKRKSRRGAAARYHTGWAACAHALLNPSPPALTACSRIDSLRRERMLFEDIHRKLQRALARKKTEMAEVINVIAESHEAREKVWRWPEAHWQRGRRGWELPAPPVCSPALAARRENFKSRRAACGFASCRVPCMQAVILQQQVKAQAERDVAHYEAEWAKLTELIEQDRKQRVGRAGRGWWDGAGGQAGKGRRAGPVLKAFAL